MTKTGNTETEKQAIEPGQTWEHDNREYEVEVIKVDSPGVVYEVLDEEFLQDRVEMAEKHMKQACMSHVSFEFEADPVDYAVHESFREQFSRVDD